MIPSNVIFYVSSGTGNSYQLCLWAQEFYSKKGIPSQIIPIGKADPLNDIKDKRSTLVFFVMPTHAFTAVWSMLKFAIFFPFMRKLPFVSLASKGSFMLGDFLIPGINGSGNFWISSILCLKGLAPEGLASINMPSNWTSVHPALSPKNVEVIFTRARVRLQHFLESFEKQKGRFVTLSNSAEFLWGIILFPITFFYFLYGKIFLAKIFFANESCQGCDLCVRSCPNRALVRKSKGLFWKYNCEACMRCYNRCPQKAIQVSYLWAFLLLVMSSLITLTGWMALILYYVVVVGLYYLLHHLASLSLPQRLLMLTTPTRFFRRYNIQGDDHGCGN